MISIITSNFVKFLTKLPLIGTAVKIQNTPYTQFKIMLEIGVFDRFRSTYGISDLSDIDLFRRYYKELSEYMEHKNN